MRKPKVIDHLRNEENPHSTKYSQVDAPSKSEFNAAKAKLDSLDNTVRTNSVKLQGWTIERNSSLGSLDFKAED